MLVFFFSSLPEKEHRTTLFRVYNLYTSEASNNNIVIIIIVDNGSRKNLRTIQEGAWYHDLQPNK